MMSFSARRMMTACALAAAGLAAAVVPSVASAAPTCHEGAAIRGKGSSAQKILQKEIWNIQFNTSANPLACNGTQGELGKPKVTYESTGSGVGLESWGVEQKTPGAQELWFAAKNAFVGTEIAPNEKQRSEILSHAEPGTELLEIPVAQPAIAILIHLPKGCLGVEGGPKSGQIALKQKTLEQAFEGKKTKWTQLLNKAKLKEATKKSCEKTAPIKRVVREDGSGTTGAFMKYLNTINKGKVPYEKGQTWAQESELAGNTEWPKEGTDAVLRGNGGGGLVKKVAETEGTIGYANVADARANLAFDPESEENAKKEKGKGGPGTPIFWAVVENAKGTYADPSTNGEVLKKSNSNCEETVYTNGFGKTKKPFPPPGVNELWNEVSVGLTQKNYEPCYLTYDLALTHYKGASKGALAGAGEAEAAEPTEEDALAVSDYIQYELSTGAGGAQEAALGEDYLGDPTNAEPNLNVLKIAQEGAKKIGF
jgi:ABC-type phosphate transport system substrate-binding protein